MNGRFRTVARGCYEFVAGDDWLIAVGALAAIGCTAALAHNGVNAWWLLPLAVVGLLGLGLHRALRG